MIKFLNKILQWLFDRDDDENINDIDIDKARANYQKYEEELKVWKETFTKKICVDINKASRSGKRYLYVEDMPEELIRHGFLQEIREHFIERGFSVEIYHVQNRVKIIWEQ